MSIYGNFKGYAAVKEQERPDGLMMILVLNPGLPDGGADRARTDDLRRARAAFSQTELLPHDILLGDTSPIIFPTLSLFHIAIKLLRYTSNP